MAENSMVDKIKIQDNSVYFIANYYKQDIKEDILNIIEEYEIEDANLETIEEQLEKGEPLILISYDTGKFSTMETMKLNLSEDLMSASIVFFPPLFGGKLITDEYIFIVLEENNVKFGINVDSIESFFENRDYTKEYNIAKGIEPKESKDGYIKYFINTSKKKPIPKILPDGSLDYKSLDIYEMVKSGDRLATQIKAVRGDYGKNIFGEEIPSLIPKDSPKLVAGKNTEILEEETLVSSVDGSVLFENGKISVLDVLEINSGVNNETGNINFPGSVSIKGDVLTGFSVVAEGNIDVIGAVEGANINAEGNIFISRGIKGGEKANVKAGKDIMVQFIENANVIADGDITAAAVMHSKIECTGSLNLIGKKALIVGGITTVAKDINVKSIGLPMSNLTKINIGIEPKVLNRYNQIIEESKTFYSRYEELQRIVKHLLKTDIKGLSEEKKELLLNSVKEKLEIKGKLINFKSEINELRPLFKKRIGVINVLGTIHRGTKIFANNAIMLVKEEINKCSVKNIDGEVKIIKE